MVALLGLTVGTVFNVAGACTQAAGQALMLGVDPCAVLDCTGGLFAGAINFCGVPGNTADDIFVDCPGMSFVV